MKTARPRTIPPAPQAGQLVDLVIGALDEEGFALGEAAGMKVRVYGALPGERVRARLQHVGRGTGEARLLAILSPSPDRQAAPGCPKGGECSACPLVVMNYPAQLAWKQAYVVAQLQRQATLSQVPVRAVIPSPKPLFYRNSAKLVVAGTFASPLIGIYRRQSHQVLDIAECPLHHPLINRIVEATKVGIKKGKIPVFHPQSGQGLLRYLVIRVAEEENRAMVVFVTAYRSYNELFHLAAALRKSVPEVTVVVQNVNPSAGNVILGQKDHFLTREKSLQASLGGKRFTISPRSFFQVNSGTARLIYEKVREWSCLTGKETVLDLYCGIGGISLFLAGQAARVIGIEAVEAAVHDAEQNARLNGIRNCSFLAGDVAALIREVGEGERRTDVVVLNPPRKGCDEGVLHQSARLAPPRIIYVSCSPKSLARDLDILSGLGYRTVEVQPVDMFPQTPHIENVALLTRE